MNTTYHIGVDVGGTKIAAGATASNNQTLVLGATRLPTPTTGVLEAIYTAIKEVIDAIDQPAASIGIGAPGVIDPQAGTVVSAGPTMPGWAGTAIKAGVEQRFGIPVAVHNDVRVLGLGESKFGAGKEFPNVLFCSLGTGVGGAIVRGGHLIESAHYTAGELRRLYGRLPNGQAALVEDFASGPGLAAQYNALAPDFGLEEAADLREVMGRIEGGCTRSAEIIEALMVAAGEAIGGFASAIDVDAVVLGGGVGNIGPVITQPFERGFRSGAIAPVDGVPVRVATLGTFAPIIGAAYLGATVLESE